MSIWDKALSLFRDNEARYRNLFFGKDQAPGDYDDSPVAEGAAYCRVWLQEMRLARGVSWFKTRYPMVYAATRYDYGGQTITVPYVGGLDYFRELTEENLDRVIQVERPLTPLFPFNRGVVDFQAALFSVDASNPVAKFLGVMGEFSKLIPVPELSSMIGVVEPLYKNIDALIGAGNGTFELGYQRAFVGAGAIGTNALRQGYFAAILAADDDPRVRDESLRVIGDSLLNAADGDRPVSLAGYNYMLFRVETRRQQDWESLRSIKTLVERAESAIENGQLQPARDLLVSIKIAIARSPDVARADREGMFARIREHLRGIGLEGPRRGVGRSLYEIMQQPAPAPDAATAEEFAQLEKLFAAPPPVNN